MPSNNMIAMGVQGIELDNPADALYKGARLRNMLQESQVHAETLRRTQLQNQESERKMRGQQMLSQAYQQNAGDPDKTLSALMQGGADPDTIQGFQKHILDLEKEKGAIKAAELPVHLANNAAARGIIQQAQALSDEDFAAQQPEISRQLAAVIPGMKPDAVVDKQHLPLLALGINTDETLNKREAEKRAQVKADQEAARAAHEQKMFAPEETKAVADAATAGATASQKKLQGAAAQLAQSANPDQYRFNLERLRATDPDTAAAFPAAFDRAKILKIGQTPNEIMTSEQTAARDANTKASQAETHSIERAGLALRQSKNTRDQQVYEQTFGAGADPALVNVDPKARTQARAAAAKAAGEYAKGQAAAADMQELLDLAKQGNKLAYKMLPVEGVLEVTTPRGTVRINRQELEAYGGAGSAWDKLTGNLGGFFSGKTISGDVLKDMEGMHKRLEEGIESTYNQKLDGINQIYRSGFQPVKSRSATPGNGGAAPASRIKILKVE